MREAWPCRLPPAAFFDDPPRGGGCGDPVVRGWGDRRGRVQPAGVGTAGTLGWRGVTGAIVGARTPEQVDGWIGAASLTLSGEDRDEVAQAIGRTGGGAGPGAPEDRGG